MDSLRSIWNQMPAVRLLIPYIIGIILCIEIKTDSLYLLIAMGSALLLFITLLSYVNATASASSVYRWRYVSGVIIFCAMLSLGYCVTYFNTENKDPHHIYNNENGLIGNKVMYTGVVIDPIVGRDKTVSVLIQLKKAIQNDSAISTSGKVVASILKDERSQNLRYGDVVQFTGVIHPYEAAKNPDQFDYQNYQALHHIYHKIYLAGSDWQVIDSNQGNATLTKIYVLREYFLYLIKDAVKDTNELGVATAIMLGYRDYVTDEITQAYAGSGVLHVLSVSGLHVAVLYFVLNALLGWMDNKRRLQIAKGLFVIAIMMLYACLTGLSPPVLRSVWMFTLITIAILIDRDVSIYNVLGVSCLGLLIWDPYYAADVGFQLSYVAVAGIVYLYPIFHILLPYSLFNQRGIFRRLLNYLYEMVWGLVCVSMAAQIATLPLSLYYFHSFPNFFLLSNLIVIPLSNLVLISGMTLFAVGWSYSLSQYAGWVFDHLLWLLNTAVFWVDALPHATSRNITMTGFESTILFITIGLLCWFVAEKRFKILLMTLLCVLLLSTSFAIDSIHKDQRNQLIVYSVTGKKAIALISGRRVFFDFDSALVNNPLLMRYNVNEHWSYCGIEEKISLTSLQENNESPGPHIYTVRGKRIAVIDGVNLPLSVKTNVDVLILSGNPKLDLEEVSKNIACKKLVFDTSNKPARIKKWLEQCQELHIDYHDCREKAFIMEL